MTDIPSLGTEFFGAIRNFNRLVNAALEDVRQDLVQQHIFGVSASNLSALAAILEFETDSPNPLQIAEKAMIDKGAFTRGLKPLEEAEFITLEQKDKTITAVALTGKGREIAQTVQGALNKKAQEILKSPEYTKLIKSLDALRHNG